MLTPAGATVADCTEPLAGLSPLRPDMRVSVACPALESARAKSSFAGTGLCDSELLELLGFKFAFRVEAEN